MSSDPRLSSMPVDALIDLLRGGDLSPVEVVGNCLDRISEVDAALNCFCFVYEEEAMRAAREAERRLRAGDAPPLAGIPIAFKDLTPTRGRTTTLGSRVYEHWVPQWSSVIVERFESAGAIVVGKTTTPEFAFSGFTRSPLWGDTRNPWDPSRTPGGSSGGAGAAVASGCVPWAEGCDMGGSVRIPAAFCGVVGLKPSHGRIPMDLVPSAFDDLSHFGPLARSIDDAALFMRYAHGPHERDARSLGDRLVFETPVAAEAAGLSLALSMDLGHMRVDDTVRAGVTRAAAALRDAGARVEEIDLGWPATVQELALDYWRVWLASFFGQHVEDWREQMDPELVALIEEGRSISAVEYKRMEIARTEAWRRLAAVLTDHHALLCPVMTMEPPPIDRPHLESLGGRDDGRFDGMDMTAVFNLFGQCPALSVPVGTSGSGLPLAVQVVGRRFDDEGVLRIGKLVEEAFGILAPAPIAPAGGG